MAVEGLLPVEFPHELKRQFANVKRQTMPTVVSCLVKQQTQIEHKN